MAGLREQIVKAHGGRQRWEQVGQVLARVSMGGWEFASRMYPVPVRDLEVAVSTRERAATFAGFPGAGYTGCFTPERVWIEDERGELSAEREQPARTFRSLRHWLLWDHLDVLYYAGLVLWHSVNLPFVLVREDLECEELPAKVVGERRLNRLRYCCHGGDLLPDGDGVLYAEPGGLVCRVDAAAPLPNAWFRLAQSWDGHESVGGLVFPTRRRFHACLATGQAWPLATLFWLALEDVSVVRRSPSGVAGGQAPAGDAEGAG